MYKAVIFDFDYTLGDSTNGIVQSANYALARLGFEERSVGEIRKTVGLTLKETFHALTGDPDDGKAARFAELFREKADQVMTDNTVLYGDTMKVLGELSRLGIKTGIVTTKFHYRIDAVLRKFDAEKLVGAVVGGEDVAAAKPDPEGLFKAIEALGADKREVLYVGDSLVDTRTAKAAGVDLAAVLTGTTDDFSEYDCVFIGKDLSEILNFVIKI